MEAVFFSLVWAFACLLPIFVWQLFLRKKTRTGIWLMTMMLCNTGSENLAQSDMLVSWLKLAIATIRELMLIFAIKTIFYQYGVVRAWRFCKGYRFQCRCCKIRLIWVTRDGWPKKKKWHGMGNFFIFWGISFCHSLFEAWAPWNIARVRSSTNPLVKRMKQDNVE